MKKSTFVAIILGTIGEILFALGMCMSLVPELNAGRSGIIMGVAEILDTEFDVRYYNKE